MLSTPSKNKKCIQHNFIYFFKKCFNTILEIFIKTLLIMTFSHLQGDFWQKWSLSLGSCLFHSYGSSGNMCPTREFPSSMSRSSHFATSVHSNMLFPTWRATLQACFRIRHRCLPEYPVLSKQLPHGTATTDWLFCSPFCFLLQWEKWVGSFVFGVGLLGNRLTWNWTKKTARILRILQLLLLMFGKKCSF